ncbi:hypothetical protein, partial [Dyadobacter bucti]|uniref:hypothetical protein n=1 Tax=Dyadobacter bucti TaxID=2572203 RepID=UPI003F6EEEE6
ERVTMHEKAQRAEIFVTKTAYHFYPDPRQGWSQQQKCHPSRGSLLCYNIIYQNNYIPLVTVQRTGRYLKIMMHYGKNNHA